MKKFFVVMLSLMALSGHVFAQDDVLTDSLKTSLTHKEEKAEKKALRKQDRKALTQHFRIGAVWTYADINSTVRFEGPYGLLSTQVDFERHLGLEDRKSIFSGSFLYRITPRSGLFASYYRLYRSNSYQLDYDIHAVVVFGPAKWVGISVGYYMFDVKVSWPVEDFRAHAAYNYSGPSVGLSFKF